MHHRAMHPCASRGGARLSGRPCAALGAALLAGGLLGCSSLGLGKVEVAEPAQAGSGACLSAAALWPAEVGGRSARSTTSSSAAVRAWGDPAIIARCGVPPIGPTTDQCLDVSGVDWVAHRLSDGVQFTTYGRSPAIEVLVPSAYQPEPLLLPAFARAAASIPQGERRCL